MDDVPSPFRERTGSITVDKTLPQLRKFVEEGGTLITIGGSTELSSYFGLPVVNALTEVGADGTEKALSQDKFYVPGSILRVKVNNTTPIAYGMPEDLDIFYSNNPVFRLLPDATHKGVDAVAWFPNAEPLRSGWAWGQHHLNGGTVIAQAKVGKGMIYLFGNEITFRAQPHGTFTFLFNGIYHSGATSVKLP
jgi:hypothetical protein